MTVPQLIERLERIDKWAAHHTPEGWVGTDYYCPPLRAYDVDGQEATGDGVYMVEIQVAVVRRLLSILKALG